MTQENIDAAVKALAGLDAFAARSAGTPANEPDAAVLGRFRAAMDDDLDTPAAVAAIDAAAARGGRVSEAARLLGISW